MTTFLEQTDTDVRRWDVPAPVQPRGVLVVVPGRGEHPGVYERFGRRISADGYLVYAVSDPTVDAAATRRQIDEVLAGESAAGPRVLVGSDSGASFAVALVTAGFDADGLVLSGLPTGPPASAELSWDDELGARTACPAHRGKLADDADFERGALSREVPADWASEGLAPVTVPVLGLHGADDPVSPLGEVRPVYARAQHAELVTITGGRHDALNDQTHRTAAATVVLFVERLRLGADLSPIARTEDLAAG